MFKFAMNAAVMLATSAAAYAAEQRNEERDFSTQQAGGVSYKLLERVDPIEAGIVIGRIEYATAENSYLVRYRGGDGRQVESFVTESALIDDPRATEKGEEPVGDRAHERAAILRYALSDLLEFGEKAVLSPDAIKAMEETLAAYSASSREAFAHTGAEAPKPTQVYESHVKIDDLKPDQPAMTGLRLSNKTLTIFYDVEDGAGGRISDTMTIQLP